MKISCTGEENVAARPQLQHRRTVTESWTSTDGDKGQEDGDKMSVRENPMIEAVV